MDQNLYLIENIIDTRVNKSTKIEEVLVKWKGFPLSAATWEPSSNFEWKVCEHLHLHPVPNFFPYTEILKNVLPIKNVDVVQNHAT
jgi:hypothetical protein